MATEKKSIPKPRRTGLWLLVIGIILLTGIYALRAVLIAPVAIAFAKHTIAENLGLQIFIGNLAGTYFSDLELSNVTTVKRLTDGPLTDLQLRRLKVSYRLLDILKGFPALLAGASIDLEGLRLSVHLTGETDSNGDGKLLEGILLPPGLPQVRIQDSFLEIKGSDYETRFEGIFLSTALSRQEGSRLKLRVAQWSVHHPALREVAGELQADLFYSRESMRMEKLMVDDQQLVKSASIGLGGLPDQIIFELSLSPAGGQLEAGGCLTAGDLQAAFSGADIELSRLSALLAPPAVTFGGLVSLNGRLQLPLERPEEMQADLTLQLGGGALSETVVNQLAFRLTADGRNLVVHDLLLADGANRITISRATMPTDVVFGADSDAMWRSLSADWHMESSDIPSLLKLAGILPAKPDGRIPSHRLIFNGQMEGGDVNIPSGRLDVENGYILLNAARIVPPIGSRKLDESPLAADLKVDLPNMDVLAQIFSLPALGGTLKGRINVSGTLQAPRGTADISGHDLTYRNKALGDLSILAHADARSVEIESAQLARGTDRAACQGTINIEQRSFGDLQVELAVSDLNPYFAELVPLFQPSAPKTLDVHGGLKATARLSGSFDRPTGSLNLQGRQLRVEGFAIGNANVDLNAAGALLQIEADVTNAQQGLHLAGDIRRNPDDTEFIIALKKAALIRNSTLLALEQETNCRVFRDGRVIFDNLVLTGSAGRFVADGHFDPAGSTELLITLSDFCSDGWLDMVAGDRLHFQGLDARIRVSGQPEAPSLAVEGTLANIGSPDVPMAFAGRFNMEYHDKIFSVREFAWQGQKGQQVQLTGTLPLDPFQTDMFVAGPIGLTGRIHITDAGVLDFVIPWTRDTGGSIQCDLNLSGTWERPAGTLHLAVHDLKRPDAIRPLPPGPYAIAGDVRIDGDLLTLEMLEAHSSDWQARARGQWAGVPPLKQLYRSDRRQLTGQIDLEGSLTVSDLSWLALEIGGVRRLAGRLEAQGNLQGPITAPRADAIIKLADGEFTPDFDMPSLRALNLEAAVTPQTVTLRALSGEMGGAPFELTGSWQLAAGSGYAADLRLQGQNLLLYRDESLRLRADTDLTLKGPLARLVLDGEVAVTDGRFSRSFGVIEGVAAAGAPDTGGGFRLFSITDPPLRDMVFNVRISARKPFEVRNNLVRGSIRPDLVLTGTGEIPLLVGQVYVESTRLYLPAGRVQLETGLVRFEKTDPERPRLDLIGTSTMLGYDITAVIDGPYDEPVITLSSIPPLPDEELLMLLLTGQPPKSSGSRASGMKQGLNVAVFLGRDLISRLFGGDGDEATEAILDRFDVEIGRGITQRGEDTIHSQFRLADDVLVDGDSLYLTGERDYFDYYNGGIKLVFRFR